MKAKNVTNELRFLIWSMKKTAQWRDSQFKIYDTKTTRFVHEYSKDGQIISVSRMSKPITNKEKNFAIKMLAKRSKENVYAYKSPNGVLYFRQDFKRPGLSE